MDLSKRETYEQKTEELLQPIVESHGFELVDVEYVKEGGNWYLRAYICLLYTSTVNAKTLQSPFIRIVPLFIKDIVVKQFYRCV